MATLNLSGRSFREEVTEYETWLRTVHAEDGLSWGRVAVCERPFGDDFPQGELRDSTAEDLDGFEERFREVLASSAGGWVNLEAVTISGEVLIVAVVWRSEPGERRSRPVSVNYSGFSQEEAERLGRAATAPAR